MSSVVLIIDDDLAMTELLSVFLKAAGYEPLAANSGGEGLRLLRESPPRLVILDLMMPDMDGWQVCKAAREFTSVPILILSALDEPSIVASVLDTGADDFLTKPCPSAVLVAHLKKLARRTESFQHFPHDRARWRLHQTQPLLPHA
jgi:DNA-binding response OmpR family regulator